MVELYLWSFDKKKNSTKIPSDAGTRMEGELKTSFNVIGLEILLNLGTFTYTPTFNYAYVPQLRRYYFITDWLYTGGLWTAVLAVDVLATYKTEIGNSIQYVTRAYSSYDPNIIDTAYPTKADGLVRSNDSLSPADFWGAAVTGTEGLIVMGTVGSSASTIGAVTYYALSMSSFSAFCQAMLGSPNWMNISAAEISTDLQKALINPTQYIVSCRWYPIKAATFTGGSAVSTINLGWWSFSVGARVLSTVGSAWVERENYFTIPKHPQRSGRYAYLDLSPYSTYMLRMLPFGIFEIDSTELYDKDQLGVLVEMNLMTGNATLKVAAKKVTDLQFNYNNAFLVTEAMVGVTLPVGQVSADIGNYQNAITAGVVAGISDIAGRY